MNTDRLKQYAYLKQQISKLEAEAEMMKDTVLEDVRQFRLENDGIYPEVEGTGRFNIKTRKTWTYTEGYEAAKSTLAKMKKEEEQTGLASYEEQELLEFRLAQEEV